MTYSIAARRLALRRTGVAIAVLAASLAVASRASAAVAVVPPDCTGGQGDNLGHAMQTAASAGGNQTLILQANACSGGPSLYLPRQLQSGFGLPPVPSGEHLTVVVAHNAQQNPGTNGAVATVDGTNADPNHNADMFTVQNGGTLTIEGVAMTGTNIGDAAHAAVRVNNGGVLTLYGAQLAGEQGLTELNLDQGGIANVNETLFNAAFGPSAIQNSGTLTLKSVTVTNNTGLGLSNSGTTTADNTVFGNNGDGASIFSCNVPIQNQDQLYDDDNSCTTGTNVGPQMGSTINGGVVPIPVANHGGPTLTANINIIDTTGTPVTTGDPMQCPSTDQRFFVIPKSSGLPQCGIGGETQTAQQAVASNPGAGQVVDVPAFTPKAPDYSTTPATMEVDASDAGSGLGPMAGSAADSTTGSNPIAGSGNSNNPANTANVNPANAVSNAVTTDGSVAVLNPFSVPTFSTSPTTGQLQVQATKDASHNTRGDTSWGFDATNWAGISVYAH